MGVTGYGSILGALRGRTPAVVWTASVEATIIWAAMWVAMLVPRSVTLTAARIGVPVALGTSVIAAFAGAATPWAIASVATAIAALGALAHPVTIDAFIDGSSYGPEQRFALRTPPLTGIVAIPPTWVVTAMIAAVPLLAVTGRLVPALVIGVAWAVALRWTIRPLHLPARRWVVFVPAGMVLSDPMALADRVLFPRRNIEAIGPAFAETDATDLTQGGLGLAIQIDLSEVFAIPLIDRDRPRDVNPSGEKTVTTDRIVLAVLRPGALLGAARDRRFAIGATRTSEPQCVHHVPASEVPVSQAAVPLPRTRSSR